MSNTVSIAPYSTTNSTNSFLLDSDGFMSGVFLDNPANRYALEGGIIASTQATPLWGGLPITALVATPGVGGSSGLGSTIQAATALSNLDGFAVFNQGSAGVISSSSNVPLYAASSSINFIRNGCGLWLPLPVKTADLATIEGGGANQAIYWDYTNNWVTVSSMGGGALGYQIIAVNTNSKIPSYSASQANWVAGSNVIIVRI